MFSRLWAFVSRLFALPRVFRARFIRVVHANGLIVRAGLRPFRVRLFEVDAPERSQAFGVETTLMPRQLVLDHGSQS